jgi:hygromycin-B 4-O-kinase
MIRKVSIITLSEAERFLRERYGADIVDVKELAVGSWSQVFSFVNKDVKYVIRWSDMNDNFERDSCAAKYNRDDLPIPQIVELGKSSKFFAISPYVNGEFLEKLSSNEIENTSESIFKMFHALRSIDLSSAEGFGFWDKDGKGSHGSWREFLLDDKNESRGSLVKGWKDNLGNPYMIHVYEQLWKRFETLVRYCPEDKSLVHSDLINRNVLAKNGNINAVLDWGSSVYGDSLYDVVWFIFYEPWYPNFGKTNLPQELLEDYKSDPTTNKVNINFRILCYQLHIGLDSIAYNSFKQDWDHAEEAVSYTLKFLNNLI